jgi:hypothetical protein
MNRSVMAVCDSNRIYCERLQEYLRNNLKLSFEYISFTDGKKLLEYLESSEVSLLIISESEYLGTGESSFERSVKNIIVLKDDEVSRTEDEKETIRYVSRLLPASEIVRQVINICTGSIQDFEGLSPEKSGKKCRVIGLYTPVSGAGQTSMALSLGGGFAREGKSILLSFESFSPLSLEFGADTDEDMTDLFYHADCNPQSIALHLERMLGHKGALDLVPPARTSIQLKEITFDKVKNMIKLLSEEAGYEYVLLDLKDYPDGFLDILSMCDVIYTIVGSDKYDQHRISLYNQTLIENGFDEVIEKTVKCRAVERSQGQMSAGAVKNLMRQGLEVTGLGA